MTRSGIYRSDLRRPCYQHACHFEPHSKSMSNHCKDRISGVLIFSTSYSVRSLHGRGIRGQPSELRELRKKNGFSRQPKTQIDAVSYVSYNETAEQNCYAVFPCRLIIRCRHPANNYRRNTYIGRLTSLRCRTENLCNIGSFSFSPSVLRTLRP